jgi:membrane protease subunit HflC
VVIGSTFAIVPETKQAVIVRFGEPERILNRYRPNEMFGASGAGLTARLPFVDRIVWIDKRIQSIDMENQQVLSTDQLRLQVDAYARYRIVDPLRMYIAARSEQNVSEQLRPILGSALRNELGRRPFAALLSPERGQMMDNIQNALNRVAVQYGAQIVDVRIKRADLPDGTPLESAYERMRTARQQEARSIQAQGLKQAQIIRAEADAEAAATYAGAFSQDPAFYDFYRAMQSYEASFLSNGDAQGGRTNIILSPDNEYLRQFTGPR